MKLKNYTIVFDCETGGLDEEKNPITQIALQLVDTLDFKVVKEYETFVKPYNDINGNRLVITPEALKSSMVSMSEIMSGVDSLKLVKTLCQFFKDSAISKHPTSRPILAGHNVGFDIRFLTYLFKLHGLRLLDFVSDERLDTLTLSKKRWELETKSDDVNGFDLKKCCSRYDIELLDAHGAMVDVRATTKLLKSIMSDLRKFNSKSNKSVAESEPKQEKKRTHYQF
jgi:DNA polymerase III epsilon subunit-like protein